MILLRTQQIDPQLAEFADQLAEWSGLPVSYLVDERAGAVAVSGRHGKISLTPESCAALGLYCPPDFAWRCGDYGFYLARKLHPQISQFWMVESDVRIIGHRPAAFFEAFASDPADLVASYVEPAPDSWPWSRALKCRDRKVFKCFFPVVRLSAKAIDEMHAARRRHARRFSRRAFWANDEGFVATSVIGSGGSWSDLNREGRRFYNEMEFSFDKIIDGDHLPQPSADARLFHPVLSGEAMRLKRQRLAERLQPPGRFARLWNAFQRRIGPDAAMTAWNLRQSW